MHCNLTLHKALFLLKEKLEMEWNHGRSITDEEYCKSIF